MFGVSCALWFPIVKLSFFPCAFGEKPRIGGACAAELAAGNLTRNWCVVPVLTATRVLAHVLVLPSQTRRVVNAHIAMERLRLDQVCGCVLPFTSCLHVHSEARECRCLKPVRMTLLLAVGHRIRRHVNHSSGYLCHIGQFQPGLPLCASPHGVRAIALPRCVVHVVTAVTPSHSLPP